METYATLEQVAQQLGTTRWTVYRIVRQRGIPIKRVGNVITVKPQDVVEAMSREKQTCG